MFERGEEGGLLEVAGLVEVGEVEDFVGFVVGGGVLGGEGGEGGGEGVVEEGKGEREEGLRGGPEEGLVPDLLELERAFHIGCLLLFLVFLFFFFLFPLLLLAKQPEHQKLRQHPKEPHQRILTNHHQRLLKVPPKHLLILLLFKTNKPEQSLLPLAPCLFLHAEDVFEDAFVSVERVGVREGEHGDGFLLEGGEGGGRVDLLDELAWVRGRGTLVEVEFDEGQRGEPGVRGGGQHGVGEYNGL